MTDQQRLEQDAARYRWLRQQRLVVTYLTRWTRDGRSWVQEHTEFPWQADWVDSLADRGLQRQAETAAKEPA